jgi:hypothetical protein
MAKEITIPWELKFDFAIRGYTSLVKAFQYAIREKYSAAAALEIFENVLKMDDRLKNLVNIILKIFKIEGDNAETIGKWIDIWYELCGYEYTLLERSKAINRVKITECFWKLAHKDLIESSFIFKTMITKYINPKAVFERPKAMCAGDPYCEYLWTLEGITQSEEDVKSKATKAVIPWELKYDYAIVGWTGILKGFLYATREKYGPTVTVEIYERVCAMDDRVENLANTIRTIFNLEGNDAEAIGKLYDLWDEFTGTEYTTLERSKIINRRKVTKCPWQTQYLDISDWMIPFTQTFVNAINPKAIFERPKGMCAGDSYCEYVWKLEK